jgi:hypothetical protein
MLQCGQLRTNVGLLHLETPAQQGVQALLQRQDRQRILLCGAPVHQRSVSPPHKKLRSFKASTCSHQGENPLVKTSYAAAATPPGLRFPCHAGICTNWHRKCCWEPHLYKIGASVLQGASDCRRHAHVPGTSHQCSMRPAMLLLHHVKP